MCRKSPPVTDRRYSAVGQALSLAFPAGRNARPAKEIHASQLDLDGVALHLVIKGRTLNAEQLGRFLLVAVRLGKRLENCLSLHVIETRYAAAARRSGSLLQRWRQLDFH